MPPKSSKTSTIQQKSSKSQTSKKRTSKLSKNQTTLDKIVKKKPTKVKTVEYVPVYQVKEFRAWLDDDSEFTLYWFDWPTSIAKQEMKDAVDTWYNKQALTHFQYKLLLNNLFGWLKKCDLYDSLTLKEWAQHYALSLSELEADVEIPKGHYMLWTLIIWQTILREKGIDVFDYPRSSVSPVIEKVATAESNDNVNIDEYFRHSQDSQQSVLHKSAPVDTCREECKSSGNVSRSLSRHVKNEFIDDEASEEDEQEYEPDSKQETSEDIIFDDE